MGYDRTRADWDSHHISKASQPFHETKIPVHSISRSLHAHRLKCLPKALPFPRRVLLIESNTLQPGN